MRLCEIILNKNGIKSVVQDICIELFWYCCKIMSINNLTFVNNLFIIIIIIYYIILYYYYYYYRPIIGLLMAITMPTSIVSQQYLMHDEMI